MTKSVDRAKLERFAHGPGAAKHRVSPFTVEAFAAVLAEAWTASDAPTPPEFDAAFQKLLEAASFSENRQVMITAGGLINEDYTLSRHAHALLEEMARLLAA